MLKLVDKELQKFDDPNPKRIVLGGMREGAILALAVFYKWPGNKPPLGGAFSMSGFNSLPRTDLTKAQSNNMA